MKSSPLHHLHSQPPSSPQAVQVPTIPNTLFPLPSLQNALLSLCFLEVKSPHLHCPPGGASPIGARCSTVHTRPQPPSLPHSRAHYVGIVRSCYSKLVLLLPSHLRCCRKMQQIPQTSAPAPLPPHPHPPLPPPSILLTGCRRILAYKWRRSLRCPALVRRPSGRNTLPAPHPLSP